MNEPWLVLGCPAARQWTTREFALLSLITVLATAVRLFRVEVWAFTDNEVVTWRGVTNLVESPFASLQGLLGGHPLVVWLIRELLDLGVLSARGEGWLRLPFVFVGITAVPLLAVVSKRLVGSAGIALLSAAVLAVHPWHVATSQAAMPAGFAATFALAALATAPLGTRSWWRIAAAAVCTLLAIGSHPCGWLALPMLAAGVVAGRPPAEDASPKVMRGVTVVAAILVPALANQWRDSGAFLLPVGGAEAFGEFAAAGGWIVLLFFAAALLAVRPLPAVAALVTILPLVSLGVATTAAVPLRADDFLPLLPVVVAMAAMAAGRAFVLIRDGAPGVGSTGVAAAALVPLSLFATQLVDTSLYSTVYRGQRPAWRDAREHAVLAREAKRGVVVGAGAGWPSLLFYLRPNHWRDPSVDAHPGMRVERLSFDRPAAALSTLLGKAQGEVVLLVLRWDEMAQVSADRQAKEVLDRSFHLVDVLASAFHGGIDTLYVFGSTAP